jgi:quinol monooxygenase YgiN
MRELAEHSRAEDGIIDYRVNTDIDDPNLFRFVEQYESEVAFGARVETDHFGEFEAALPELPDGEPVRRRERQRRRTLVLPAEIVSNFENHSLWIPITSRRASKASLNLRPRQELFK